MFARMFYFVLVWAWTSFIFPIHIDIKVPTVQEEMQKIMLEGPQGIASFQEKIRFAEIKNLHEDLELQEIVKKSLAKQI